MWRLQRKTKLVGHQNLNLGHSSNAFPNMQYPDNVFFYYHNVYQNQKLKWLPSQIADIHNHLL
jgi:hypothetical protein